MPIAPKTNKIFAPIKGNVNVDANFSQFVSTIDKSILDNHNEAMTNLLRSAHTIVGGDKNKEQFTMRGHLDSLEQVLNDMVTELKYHQQQV